ncbi:MAG: transcriptional regulator [Planctomycetes bacterium]|nr:transcriptional regulator [Planctomycetota bacterium]
MPNEKSSTRQEILALIKRRGEATVKQLSREVGISSMGVRQHLATLEKERLVQWRNERQKVGRPIQVYSLTETAEKLFPSTYGPLVISLLDQLAEMDGTEKVLQLLKSRQERLRAEYRKRMEGLAGEDRFRALAKIRDEEGYICESFVNSRGEDCLVEHHCPIAFVARRYPQVCSYEQDLLEQALEAKLVRREYLISGGKSCSYQKVLQKESDDE